MQKIIALESQVKHKWKKNLNFFHFSILFYFHFLFMRFTRDSRIHAAENKGGWKMKNHKIYCREIFTRLPISMLFCLCCSFFLSQGSAILLQREASETSSNQNRSQRTAGRKKRGVVKLKKKERWDWRLQGEFVTKKGSLFVAATVERRRKHDALHYWLLSSAFFPILFFLIAVESQLFEQINFPLSEKSFFNFIANAVSFCLIFI